MKISELAKDLNITSKEVIKFLQDNGYDYKSPQKNLVEEEENLVRKGLTAGSAKTEKAEAKADKKEEAKPDKKEEKEAPVKEEGKETVTKEESPKAEDRPKKKKNIIIVGGKPAGQNSGRPAQRPGQPVQNKKPAANVNVRPSGLIRPTTPPSATPSVNFVPAGNPNSRPQSAPKKDAEVNAEQNTRPVSERSENRGERPQNNANRNDRPQGGFNKERGDRPQGGFNRDNRGERPQGGFN